MTEGQARSSHALDGDLEMRDVAKPQGTLEVRFDAHRGDAEIALAEQSRVAARQLAEQRLECVVAVLAVLGKKTIPAASTSANRTGRRKTNTSDAGRRERDFLHQAHVVAF